MYIRSEASAKITNQSIFFVALLALWNNIVFAGIEIPDKKYLQTPKVANSSDGNKSLVSVSPKIVTIDGKKVASNTLLVKLKNGLSQQSESVRSLLFQSDLVVSKVYKSVPSLQKLEFKSQGASVLQQQVRLETEITNLRKSGLFEYVEPDWIVNLQITPSDTAFADGTLWGLKNTGQNGGTSGIDINAELAWDIESGSANVIVGVVDTGIRYTHQDLIDNMWTNPGEIPANGIDDDSNGYIDDVYGINAINVSGDPFDDNDHGTHVAGTIGASAFDAGGHVGVAHNVSLMALKFLDANGSGSTSDAIASIEYAINEGADILNNSWGGGGFSQALFDVIQAANSAGILFVAAAGNNGSNNDTTEKYPANYSNPNVLSVAAIDRNGLLASFSNYGAITVDIAAPGVKIYSSTAGSDNEYSSFNGTSMAVPHVVGVAALIKSQNGLEDSMVIKNKIMDSAQPLNLLTNQVVTGGMLDAVAALNATLDGVMELRASSNESVFIAGEAADFYISVSDIYQILGASVQGSFVNSSDQTFGDDGLPPDVTANDGIYSATLITPSDAGIRNLTVSATASGKTPANEVFPFEIIAQIVNNNFADRIILPAESNQAVGHNRNATSEPDEPRNPDVAGGKTVWWQWNAGSSAAVTISTAGSNYDTTLAVYTGSSLANLVLVGSNDDFGSLQSAVSFNAIDGVAYLVQVDGYAGAEGDIQLNYLPADGGQVGIGPDNDHFSNATELVGSSGNLQGTNVNSSGEDSEPDHAGVSNPIASVWHKITPQASGTLVINTSGSDFDTVLAIYSGSSLTNLIEIDSDDDGFGLGLQSSVSAIVTAGTTYSVAVAGFWGATGQINLNYALEPDGSGGGGSSSGGGGGAVGFVLLFGLAIPGVIIRIRKVIRKYNGASI